MTDLDELRNEIDHLSWPPPPARDAAARTRREAARRVTRRRWVVSVACAATVGVGAVAVVAIDGFGDQQSGPSVTASSDPPAVEDLVVADGYRPVGALGLVFQVPQGWGTGEDACDGSPEADTVTFGEGVDCLVPNPPKVSYLMITRPDNDHVADVLMQIDFAATTIDGIRVEASQPVAIDGLWTFAVANAGGEVAVFRSVDETTADHARHSLQAVPDGWVVIPPVPGLTPEEVWSALSDLGLEPIVRDVPVTDDISRGIVTSLDPPVASVVKVGQRVTILRTTE